MEINTKEVEHSFLLVENHLLEGCLDPVKRGGVFLFSINEDSVFRASEMGKKATVFCSVKGKRLFITGKAFFQTPSRVLLRPETELQPDRREELRYETPALAASISGEKCFFRQERFNSTILEISLHGANIETRHLLKKKTVYYMETAFPYHHETLEFSSSIAPAETRKKHDLYIHRVVFTYTDIVSQSNLARYIKSLAS